jgi:hypothetical protein
MGAKIGLGKIFGFQVGAMLVPSCNQTIATWYYAAGCRRGVSF